MPKNKNVPSNKCLPVPYAKGFKLPTKRQQEKAIGFAQHTEIPSEFRPEQKLFSGIPKCTSIDDWLAQYNEEGQSFDQFLRECPWLSRRKRKYMKQTFDQDGITIKEKYPDGKIYLVPLGDFDDSSPDFDDLVEYTRIFLQLPVEKLPPINLDIENNKIYFIHPEDTNESGDRSKRKNRQLLPSRFHHSKQRTFYQIGINPVLLLLRQYIPDDAICLVALTMSDLYEDKTDLFVAGMAAGQHRVALFSLCRYNPRLTCSQEFWYDIKYCRKAKAFTKSNGHDNVILQRGCRLLVHEISHLLGVAHCIYFACCMNGSGHLDEDFSQPMTLCPVDLRKLHTLVGFDMAERYKQLKLFFEKHRFEGKEWFERRLQMLDSK